MELTRTLLVAATVLSSLTAGLLFAFAVLLMPGIRGLDDRAFVRAFQLMDRIIQDNHPPFMLVWVGSVVTLAGALVVGVGRLAGQVTVERTMGSRACGDHGYTSGGGPCSSGPRYSRPCRTFSRLGWPIDSTS